MEPYRLHINETGYSSYLPAKQNISCKYSSELDINYNHKHMTPHQNYLNEEILGLTSSVINDAKYHPTKQFSSAMKKIRPNHTHVPFHKYIFSFS